MRSYGARLQIGGQNLFGCKRCPWFPPSHRTQFYQHMSQVHALSEDEAECDVLGSAEGEAERGEGEAEPDWGDWGGMVDFGEAESSAAQPDAVPQQLAVTHQRLGLFAVMSSAARSAVVDAEEPAAPDSEPDSDNEAHR